MSRQVADSESISILLVEDDPDFLDLLTGMLSEEGYNVLGAASGESALQIAESNVFDLVVTDVKLGGIDGLDTLAELKKGQSELQSLVITGYATEADSVRAISLGVGNYMRKPFMLPDFLRAVNQLVEEIHKERQLSRYFSSVNDTVLWGLETLLKSDPDQLETAKYAELSARQNGLSAGTARHVRLAVLAAAVRKAGSGSQVSFLFDILPSESAWLVERLEKNLPPESLEEELAAHALSGEMPSFQQSEVAENGEDELQTSSQTESSTSLLALARALEVSGDLEGASLVLDRIESVSRESSSQAFLFQARVQQTKGRFVEVESLLSQADASAKDLVSRSKVKLEGGLLFKEIGRADTAREWLQAAVEGFGELKNSTDCARAQLALWATTEDTGAYKPETLAKLLSPGSLEIFLGSARWLYPYVLSLPPSALVSRALQRLTRNLPQLVIGVLSGELSEAHKLTGLRLIAQVGVDGYEDFLQEMMLEQSPVLRDLAQRILTESTTLALAPVLRIYSLGTMGVWVGDRKIPDKGWIGSKIAYMLIYMAQSSGKLLNQDQLIEVFWPDSARGSKNLSQAIFRLRNALRSPEWPESLDYIFRSGNQVGLNPDQTVWFDAAVLRHSIEDADRMISEDRSADAADQLQQAMELDRGPYLEACYEDWALEHRAHLDGEIARGLNILSEIRLDQGRPDSALAVAQHLLEKDPLEERANKNLFQAYLDSGQPTEVLRVFERLEQKLKRDLAIEPSIDLIKLYHLAKLKV